jgi:hypothetical protein
MGAAILSGFHLLGPLHRAAIVRVHSSSTSSHARCGPGSSSPLRSGLRVSDFGHPLYPAHHGRRAVSLLAAFEVRVAEGEF